MIESKYLKDDIRNIQKLLAIPTLKGFETKNIAKLLKLSKIRRYDDGEAIIEEGSTDKWLYFLLSGGISVSKGNTEICTIDKMGEIFGEMRIVDGLSRSTSVFAKGYTTCLAIDTSSTHRLGADDEAAELLTLLYKVAAEFISMRLRLSNEKLTAAQLEIDRLKKRVSRS